MAKSNLTERTTRQLNQLEEQIGYTFQSPLLLLQAVTHRSMEGSINNERLEFLGDGVLNLLIAEHLIAAFPRADEGQLSRLRAKLVCKEALARIGKSLNLGPTIQLGLGEAKTGGQQRNSIVADAVEAIIGGIFQETGYAATKVLVLEWFKNLLNEVDLEAAQKDPKTRLQEWSQQRYGCLPEYTVLHSSLEAGITTFEVEVELKAKQLKSTASANSRKKAEQIAATQLLKTIESNS